MCVPNNINPMRRGKIIFKGSFGDYFLKALLLTFLIPFTFGIIIPYLAYWNIKYFVANLEIEIPDSK